MVLNFPYTVDDEPADTWTVEQVMHWWLLRAQAENEGQFESIAADLQQQLDAGKKEIWQAHEQVADLLNQEHGDGEDEDDVSDNEENVMDTGTHDDIISKDDISKPAASSDKSANAEAGSTRTRSNKPDKKIHVVIVDGPYEGNAYDLVVKTKQHAWVGRSQGKKFRDKGISLPKDSEVSTSHGRFEYQRGKFYYMDAASTNGSLIGNEYLEPNVPYELENGMYITAGQTIMQVTLTHS